MINHNDETSTRKQTVPYWEKVTMTIEEAAEYSGIGRDTLYRLSNQNNCPFVLWIGTKRRIKRKKLEDYISGAFSI